MPGAADIIRLLGLRPLPVEGGYYAETYRAPGPPGSDGTPGRAQATAIYYLLTPDTFSEMHRLAADEIYHFYLGDPVELLLLPPDGSGATVTLGPDLGSGMRVQQVVRAGTWQGSRLVAGGSWALLGTTMAPGFDLEDYESGHADALAAAYPAHAATIGSLTRR